MQRTSSSIKNTTDNFSISHATTVNKVDQAIRNIQEPEDTLILLIEGNVSKAVYHKKVDSSYEMDYKIRSENIYIILQKLQEFLKNETCNIFTIGKFKLIIKDSQFNGVLIEFRDRQSNKLIFSKTGTQSFKTDLLKILEIHISNYKLSKGTFPFNNQNISRSHEVETALNNNQENLKQDNSFSLMSEGCDQKWIKNEMYVNVISGAELKQHGDTGIYINDTLAPRLVVMDGVASLSPLTMNNFVLRIGVGVRLCLRYIDSCIREGKQITLKLIGNGTGAYLIAIIYTQLQDILQNPNNELAKTFTQEFRNQFLDKISIDTMKKHEIKYFLYLSNILNGGITTQYDLDKPGKDCWLSKPVNGSTYVILENARYDDETSVFKPKHKILTESGAHEISHLTLNPVEIPLLVISEKTTMERSQRLNLNENSQSVRLFHQLWGMDYQLKSVEHKHNQFNKKVSGGKRNLVYKISKNLNSSSSSNNNNSSSSSSLKDDSNESQLRVTSYSSSNNNNNSSSSSSLNNNVNDHRSSDTDSIYSEISNTSTNQNMDYDNLSGSDEDFSDSGNLSNSSSTNDISGLENTNSSSVESYKRQKPKPQLLYASSSMINLSNTLNQPKQELKTQEWHAFFYKHVSEYNKTDPSDEEISTFYEEWKLKNFVPNPNPVPKQSLYNPKPDIYKGTEKAGGKKSFFYKPGDGTGIVKVGAGNGPAAEFKHEVQMVKYFDELRQKLPPEEMKQLEDLYKFQYPLPYPLHHYAIVKQAGINTCDDLRNLKITKKFAAEIVIEMLKATCISMKYAITHGDLHLENILLIVVNQGGNYVPGAKIGSNGEIYTLNSEDHSRVPRQDLKWKLILIDFGNHNKSGTDFYKELEQEYNRELKQVAGIAHQANLAGRQQGALFDLRYQIRGGQTNRRLTTALSNLANNSKGKKHHPLHEILKYATYTETEVDNFFDTKGLKFYMAIKFVMKNLDLTFKQKTEIIQAYFTDFQNILIAKFNLNSPKFNSNDPKSIRKKIDMPFLNQDILKAIFNLQNGRMSFYEAVMIIKNSSTITKLEYSTAIGIFSNILNFLYDIINGVVKFQENQNVEYSLQNSNNELKIKFSKSISSNIIISISYTKNIQYVTDFVKNTKNMQKTTSFVTETIGIYNFKNLYHTLSAQRNAIEQFNNISFFNNNMNTSLIQFKELKKSNIFNKTACFTLICLGSGYTDQQTAEAYNSALYQAYTLLKEVNSSLIYGPTGTGENFDKNIMDGLVKCLNYIEGTADKQKVTGGAVINLKIVGHSRGACETASIYHYMQKLFSQDYLDKLFSTPATSGNPPNSAFENALKEALINAGYTIEMLETLLQKLKGKTINYYLCLLDPVAGPTELKGKVNNLPGPVFDGQVYVQIHFSTLEARPAFDFSHITVDNPVNMHVIILCLESSHDNLATLSHSNTNNQLSCRILSQVLDIKPDHLLTTSTQPQKNLNDQVEPETTNFITDMPTNLTGILNKGAATATDFIFSIGIISNKRPFITNTFGKNTNYYTQVLQIFNEQKVKEISESKSAIK